MTDLASLAIGVDLGATKIAAALVSADGQVLNSTQCLTSAERGAAFVIDRIANLVSELADQAPTPPWGVGIGSPGQVNARQGIVRNAVNLGWMEVALADEVFARLRGRLPVFIQKDANLSALGEFYFGAARDCPDFVYLSVGSGLGGGVIANGQLVTGADGNAAELGHISLDPNGLPCVCGSFGCAETIISGPGLLNLVSRWLGKGCYPSSLATGMELSTTAILEAARRDDPLCLAALHEAGRNLGIVMASCVAVLNPARIVVGGGLGLAAFDWLAGAAMGELQRRTLPASYHHLAVLPSQVPSSAVGAACLVWYSANYSNPHPKEVVN